MKNREFVKMKINLTIAGCVISLVFLWLAGALFCNSPTVLVPYKELQTMGYPEGSRIAWRTEGWGVGYFGKWGVSSIHDIGEHLEKK